MKGSASDGEQAVFEGFAFRAALFREGDVLLCRDPGSLISRAIRYATGGTFSHAAICTYRSLFIEADFPGVAEFSLARLNLAERPNARILRLKPSVPNTRELAAAAAQAALRYQTGEYDKIAAIGSRFGGAKTTSGIFCSYLVSAAYCAGGLNPTGDEAKPPEQTTPADIENSAFFDDITDQMIMRAVFDPARGTHYFLDRAPLYARGTPNSEKDLPTPAQAYNIGLRKVGERVSAFLEAKGLPPVPNYPKAQLSLAQYQHAPWFPELDELFASELRAHAFPALLATQPIVAEARQMNDEWMKRDLAAGSLDYASFQLVAADVAERVETTRKLIADRQLSIYTFRLVVQTVGWKSMEALAEAEELICAGLEENLNSSERQWQELQRHAEQRGWPMPSDRG